MKLNSKSPDMTEVQQSDAVEGEIRLPNLSQNTMLGDVFRLFCSNERYREDMLKPFLKNGKVYATDAYTVIFTDEVNCIFDFVKDLPKPPNVQAIIPKENTNKVLYLNENDFNKYKTKDEFEFFGEDIKCSTCYGEGVVEWEFEHWTKEFDCPKCGGSGFEKEKYKRKTGNKTFGDCLIAFDNAYFDMKLFYRLLQVQNFIKEPIKLVYSIGDKNGLRMFEIGYLKIMMMPKAIYNNNPVSDYEGILNIA